jgi:hypothetical protein
LGGWCLTITENYEDRGPNRKIARGFQVDGSIRQSSATFALSTMKVVFRSEVVIGLSPHSPFLGAFPTDLGEDGDDRAASRGPEKQISRSEIY